MMRRSHELLVVAAVVARPVTAPPVPNATVTMFAPVLTMLNRIVLPTLQRGIAATMSAAVGSVMVMSEAVAYVMIPPRSIAAVVLPAPAVMPVVTDVYRITVPEMLPLAWIEPDVELDP